MNIASEIPTEILEKIFLLAIDVPISISNIRDNRFPWALNRVCKSWRSTFVTYPHLWTWITIDLYPSGQDLNAVNKCLPLCLERSRNYPLDISLHLPRNGPSFAFVWYTFLSCSDRWRTVYLSNVLNSQFVALNSCTGAIPILESLTIHSHMDIRYDDFTYFTAFQIAPHLTRFTLLNSTAQSAARKWSLPWAQLTTLMLRLTEIDGMDQLYVLLKQLRDIEELRLIIGAGAGAYFDDFIHNTCAPQCLQRLRVLQVCCIEILDLITAPSLSELYLDGSEFFYPLMGDDDGVLAEEILSDFIQRSSCKIQKLTLSDFSEHPFTPLAQSFLDVVELCLTDALMCLEDLLPPNQFPSLRVLDCIAHKEDAEDFIETLLVTLEVRNDSSARCLGAPLTKVTFRPVLEDGEASALATTTDWASFESYVQAGSWASIQSMID